MRRGRWWWETRCESNGDRRRSSVLSPYTCGQLECRVLRPKRTTTTTTTDDKRQLTQPTPGTTTPKAKTTPPLSLVKTNKCPSSQTDKEKICTPNPLLLVSSSLNAMLPAIDLSSNIYIPMALQIHLNLLPQKPGLTTPPIPNPNTTACWRKNGPA